MLFDFASSLVVAEVRVGTSGTAKVLGVFLEIRLACGRRFRGTTSRREAEQRDSHRQRNQPPGGNAAMLINSPTSDDGQSRKRFHNSTRVVPDQKPGVPHSGATGMSFERTRRVSAAGGFSDISRNLSSPVATIRGLNDDEWPEKIVVLELSRE